jgi:hypothetical protein
VARITYKTILAIIGRINSFADESDVQIKQLWDNFNKSKQNLEQQLNLFLSNAKKEYENGIGGVGKKAKALNDNAESIYQEVLLLDASLANADKYYVKTRKEKSEELTGKTNPSILDESDVFSALDKLKAQFKVLADKYSSENLPPLIDGVVYIFSKHRKQDYEDLILLKNTLEKLMEEIRALVPELSSDSLKTYEDSYNQKCAKIKTKYQSELNKLNTNYEANVERMADSICTQLDVILPDELIHAISEINALYPAKFSTLTPGYDFWDGCIILGHINFPLELYVSSNILLSLITDKCSPILVNKKHLRFPMLCSLSEGFNLLVRHISDNTYKNRFIRSLIQGLIASVPVRHLSFTIIDSEQRGLNAAAFSDFIEELPDLFEGEIVTSLEDVEKSIKSIYFFIDSSHPVQLSQLCKGLSDTSIEDEPHTSDKVIVFNPNANDDLPVLKFIIVFDHPEYLGENNVALINGIIENGNSRGVYTIIGYNTDGNASPLAQSPYRENKCLVFQQAIDVFLYYDLKLTYLNAVKDCEFYRLTKDYLLLCCAISQNASWQDENIGILVSAVDQKTVLAAVANIKDRQEKYHNEYGVTPAADARFLKTVAIGNLLYPLSIITNSGFRGQVEEELSPPSAETFNVTINFNLDINNNILLICGEKQLQSSRKFIHSMMWKLLSSIPVFKIKYCIFDSERRGNNITPFLDFRQKSPEIFDNQIYTTQDAMYERLKKLNSYIDEFIQNKLANHFENIIEYNENMPNRTEALIFLFVFDFPRNFDARGIDLLLNIMNTGGKCGVYTIIHYNKNIPFSKYETIDEYLNEIKKYCIVIENIDNCFYLQPYGLPFENPPEFSKADIASYIKDYLNVSTNLKSKGVSFADIIHKPHFESSSTEKLTIPVGVGDGESVVSLVFGQGSSHHGIMAGATGSGKSTLLHTIIMSSMLNHSPDKLNLYLMDFKSGTEFKIYESVKLPHIKLLALDAMQEFGESILENLVAEMQRRSGLFKDAGQSSLSDYVNNTGNPMPRILVIMDEFQILFNDSANRKVAMNCAELSKRLVTEGRAFGIHLLMATQTTKVISDLTLSHGVIEQMRVRIGLKCGEDDARYLFTDRNDTKALELMKGPIGTAVLNPEYIESDNIGFRTAYCSKEMQEKYLAQIAEEYSGSTDVTRIFEGERVVSITEHLKENKIGVTSESIVNLYMGIMIRVSPPFVMHLDRRRRHNLLICGANEKMSENLSNLCLFSALHNKNCDVYCIDGEDLLGESASSDFYNQLKMFSSKFKLSKNRKEIVEFLDIIYDGYDKKKQGEKLGEVLVVIKNLQYIDILKMMLKGESIDERIFENDMRVGSVEGFDFGVSTDSNMSNLSHTEKLLELVNDGASYGVHFAISSLEYQCIKENMYYGENVLTKFPERIIFALNSTDSDSLIDGVSVSNLRDNTVYYTNGVRDTFQYKPFVLPNANDLNEYLGFLSNGQR